MGIGHGGQIARAVEGGEVEVPEEEQEDEAEEGGGCLGVHKEGAVEGEDAGERGAEAAGGVSRM